MAFFRRGRAQGQYADQPPPVPPKPRPSPFATLTTHQPSPAHAHPPHTQCNKKHPHHHADPSSHTHEPISVPLYSRPTYTHSRWLHPDPTPYIPSPEYAHGTWMKGLFTSKKKGGGIPRSHAKELGQMTGHARKAERARRLDDQAREYAVLKVETEQDRLRAMRREGKRQKKENARQTDQYATAPQQTSNANVPTRHAEQPQYVQPASPVQSQTHVHLDPGRSSGRMRNIGTQGVSPSGGQRRGWMARHGMAPTDEERDY